MSYLGEKSQSVTCSSLKIKTIIRKCNESIVDLKEKIEKMELELIREKRKEVFVCSEDGTYPTGVRTRNSGAVLNTVMAYDEENNSKVVCKLNK